MKQRQLVRAAGVAIAGSLALLASNSVLSADANIAKKPLKANALGSMGPVPKAQCGRWDWTESGLQGQTTNWERFSGDSEGGYNCNLELVGQVNVEGTFSQDGPAYYDHCAYMATENRSVQQHPGIVVVDVSDPTNPVVTKFLDDTPAGLNPHEAVKINQPRGLLGLAQSSGPNFAVYDLTKDCAHPILASSITVPGSSGHMGNWAEDGKTYYITQSFEGVGSIIGVVDVTDPYNAQPLPAWIVDGNGRPHDLNLNKDGTRLYAGQAGSYGNVGNTAFGTGPDGLVILDVSDYQFRRPNPQMKVVSTVFWDDQGTAEQMLPLYYSNGHSYIVSTDESGGQNGVGGLPAACARGASPYGYSNIIDITDETHPKIVAKIMLEIHDPANCDAILEQLPEPGGPMLDLSTERCAPDRPDNPTMLACGSRGTGTRVYDIRDILHPKEIAYWKGPAPRTAFLPGSGSWSPTVDRTVEKQAGLPRLVKVPAANGKGREWNLWLVGDAGGFQVLRFSDEFMQTKVGKSIHAEASRESAD